MACGKIKKWNGQTGFIKDDAGGPDLFFGGWSLQGLSPAQVQLGMKVEFDVSDGPKGRKADRISPLSGSASVSIETVCGSANLSRRHLDSTHPALDLQAAVPTPWVLPRTVQQVIHRIRVEDRHPLIQLDRLSLPGDQKVQRSALDEVVRTSGDPRLLAELDQRRRQLLGTQSPRDLFAAWEQETDSSLTLHLSRAAVLENANLALHPVYGFAYLPGSGLKGMARAAAQELLNYSPEQILSIFGNDPGEGREGYQRAGEVVFHDAWPISWPRLTVDIVNNHHPEYYRGNDAPGDWESPKPAYFLAVAPGTKFGFVLKMRRQDGDIGLLRGATEALQLALQYSGAGAKTAAGYGGFKPLANATLSAATASVPVNAKRPKTDQWTLLLESPAFLAGASQSLEDCDLRSATLRGQLRAWWRILHAGYVTVDQLRQLEAAVWGNTVQGSPLRIRLRTVQPLQARLYQHPSERYSGLKYLAYGMDETSRGERKQRAVASSRGGWELMCLVRPSNFVAASEKTHSETTGRPIAAEQVRLQFQAALWLLTHFGGVGSKGRKGFGSLRIEGALEVTTIEQAMEAAAGLRRSLGIDQNFQESLADSPALGHPDRQVSELAIVALDAWEAIETAGRAYAAVAGDFKHQETKIALGLPRKIHGPREKPLAHQSKANHERPKFLETSKQTSGKRQEARYASPIHLHLSQVEPGRWAVRLLALPVKYLPDIGSHRTTAEFLKKFVERFNHEIRIGKNFSSKSKAIAITAPQSPTRIVQGFAQVQVTVLEIKQVGNRHQLKVQEADKPKPGMLVDGTPPALLPEVGQLITAYRSTTSDLNSPRYRWTPPDSKPPKGGQRRGNRN